MRASLGLVLVVAASGLFVGSNTHALAQERMVVATSGRAIGPGGSGRLTRELVERMADRLSLDEIQREIAMELFRELGSTRQELGDAMRQAIEAARTEVDDGDFAAMITKIRSLTSAYSDRMSELEAVFMSDLQAMLTEEQGQLWSHAQRMYRRGTQMQSLTRSQARVDIDKLVRDEFDAAAENEDIREALERWEMQIDSMLLDRKRKADAMEDGNDGGFQELVIGGTDDPYKDLREVDGRIVTLGEQTVRAIAGILEDNAIEEAWLRRAFARVYRETDGEKRLAAAMELGGLSDEQREQLDAASTQHYREVGPARDRWVKAESEREEENMLPPGVSVVISGQGESPSDEARKAVDDLDERLERRLAAILSDAQLAELPERAGENADVLFRPRPVDGQTIRIGG